MMEGRVVHIGSDHGGYDLKCQIIEFLKEKGYSTNDLGTYDKSSVDYPEFGKKVARAVQKDKCPGIIICGTGIGISIAANRFTGIRAALCHSTEYARLAREHNDANILALGGRFTGAFLAFKIAEVFLNTEFTGGRHLRRVKMIDNK
ncbi:MAG: ribose 5-phosphate isomerase B [Candidatus Delongbacteria bacterium]